MFCIFTFIVHSQTNEFLSILLGLLWEKICEPFNVAWRGKTVGKSSLSCEAFFTFLCYWFYGCFAIPVNSKFWGRLSVQWNSSFQSSTSLSSFIDKILNRGESQRFSQSVKTFWAHFVFKILKNEKICFILYNVINKLHSSTTHLKYRLNTTH